jgi:hypothetical protein
VVRTRVLEKCITHQPLQVYESSMKPSPCFQFDDDPSAASEERIVEVASGREMP